MKIQIEAVELEYGQDDFEVELESWATGGLVVVEIAFKGERATVRLSDLQQALKAFGG